VGVLERRIGELRKRARRADMPWGVKVSGMEAYALCSCAGEMRCRSGGW
jgi:hypothetical protein